jgi:hypothetical protein
MSKALAGCREVYTRVDRGTAEPLMMHVVGKDNYEKDLVSLGHAEKITNFLIAHPDKTTGKALVLILSTSDDFSVGVGSTRAAILASLLNQSTKVSASQASQDLTAATELDGCQKNLFNAGDDYVDLVMKFVVRKMTLWLANRRASHRLPAPSSADLSRPQRPPHMLSLRSAQSKVSNLNSRRASPPL